jgi:hypothetical protein
MSNPILSSSRLAAPRRMRPMTAHGSRRAKTRSSPRGSRLCILAARDARALPGKLSLEKQRAQGMPGARCTHGFVQRKHEVVHRFTGTFRHSLRNGFTVSFVLSPVIGLSCHRRRRKISSANLTPASRRQDHTTSPSASNAVRPLALSASTAPRPTSVTIAKRPLVRERDGRSCNCDLG